MKAHCGGGYFGARNPFSDVRLHLQDNGCTRNPIPLMLEPKCEVSGLRTSQGGMGTRLIQSFDESFVIINEIVVCLKRRSRSLMALSP
jgi:hypothetical protein